MLVWMLQNSWGPLRFKQLSFKKWKEHAALRKKRRIEAIKKLKRVVRASFLGTAQVVMKFWLRWALYTRTIRTQARFTAHGILQGCAVGTYLEVDGTSVHCYLMAPALTVWVPGLQIAAPEFSNFLPWQSWLYKHEHSARVKLRADKQRTTFVKRYLFNYWRFYVNRNKRMRKAWSFADTHRDFLLMWASMLAFRANRLEATKARRMKRNVLRHWHAAMRHTTEHRQLHISTLLVRPSNFACAQSNTVYPLL